jgi:hypothetical protein
MSTEEVPEKMYANTERMAIEQAVHANLPALRASFDLTEGQAAEMAKTHQELLTGVIPLSEAPAIHRAITSGLTRVRVSEKDDEDEARRIQMQHDEIVGAIHAEYGWRADLVWKRTKEMIQAKPKLVELLHQAGLDNDPGVLMAIARRAKCQLQQEGKL